MDLQMAQKRCCFNGAEALGLNDMKGLLRGLRKKRCVCPKLWRCGWQHMCSTLKVHVRDQSLFSYIALQNNKCLTINLPEMLNVKTVFSFMEGEEKNIKRSLPPFFIQLVSPSGHFFSASLFISNGLRRHFCALCSFHVCQIKDG